MRLLEARRSAVSMWVTAGSMGDGSYAAEYLAAICRIWRRSTTAGQTQPRRFVNRDLENYGGPPKRGPLASKDSQNLTRFFGAKTGTVFGTVSLGDLEP